ncbi:hypothetical protein FOA52_007110 [Chlamydomonas sp. UWO 241]|nr:hypothetical protein FOA52_007110 [Chlamydomonas sp. UWO 241]
MRDPARAVATAAAAATAMGMGGIRMVAPLPCWPAGGTAAAGASTSAGAAPNHAGALSHPAGVPAQPPHEDAALKEALGKVPEGAAGELARMFVQLRARVSEVEASGEAARTEASQALADADARVAAAEARAAAAEDAMRQMKDENLKETLANIRMGLRASAASDSSASPCNSETGCVDQVLGDGMCAVMSNEARTPATSQPPDSTSHQPSATNDHPASHPPATSENKEKPD